MVCWRRGQSLSMIASMSSRCRRYGLSLATSVLLIVGLGTSVYAKSYAIEIRTSPPGAKIYLGDKDGALLGTTPYRGKLDEGAYTLYLKKRGFEPMYQSIEVKKKKRKRRGRQEFSYDLKEVQYGQVEVIAAPNAEAIDDARILIDGDEVGNAPDTIDEVAVGPHQLEVLREGYEVFESWIEVEEDRTTTVEVELQEDPEAIYGADERSTGRDTRKNVGKSEGVDDEDPNAVSSQTVRGAEIPHPYVVLSIGPELGNRTFEYVIPSGVSNAPNIRPYDAAMVPLARIRLQVYPLAGASMPLLAGWGFSGSYAHAKSVSSQTDDDQTLDTRWIEWDANLRFLLRLGRSAIGAEVGYAAQTFEFDADGVVGPLIEEVPSVDYRFTRIGLDFAFQITPAIGAWVGGNFRIVSALGKLSTRFEETRVTAFGGQAGASYAFSKSIQVQLILNYSRYQHEFIFREAGEQVSADGTDEFKGAMLGLAFML